MDDKHITAHQHGKGSQPQRSILLFISIVKTQRFLRALEDSTFLSFTTSQRCVCSATVSFEGRKEGNNRTIRVEVGEERGRLCLPIRVCVRDLACDEFFLLCLQFLKTAVQNAEKP